jgi:glutamate-1-semialdehyde 2,1-aminomutase
MIAQKRERDMSLFEQAKKYIAGGVNSPVRAFTAVGGDPVFFKRAKGAWLYTEDGEKMIDYVGSWGSMILGHAHTDVVKAVTNAAQNGLSFGAPTIAETLLAQKVCEFIPSIERIRMVNSGTEATMSAIRLARGFTGRDKIIKFEGCYHGHSDSLLVKTGSGALTLGVPNSPGVPNGLAKHTITIDFNDTATMERVFSEFGTQIACVIVEPIAGNMNMVLPEPGFLENIRSQCDQHAAILIFDEVMTGFRVAKGGAQEIFDIRPDLTTLGKIIGGGMPAAAFGGRADIMASIAPDGPVYQAGTLSGNPLAMAAGLATLQALESPSFYSSLGERTQQLANGLAELAHSAGVPLAVEAIGGMFGFVFSADGPIRRFTQVAMADTDMFRQFFHGMLKANIYFSPSAFEVGFVSDAHGDKEITETLLQAKRVFATLKP